jgi:translation elongation factor EF-G
MLNRVLNVVFTIFSDAGKTALTDPRLALKGSIMIDGAGEAA